MTGGWMEGWRELVGVYRRTVSGKDGKIGRNKRDGAS